MKKGVAKLNSYSYLTDEIPVTKRKKNNFVIPVP
jgi:hypothetical protein